MMDLGFQRGTELMGIKIIGKTLQFCKMQGGVYVYAPIEGLRFNVGSILKEFPDLKGKPQKEIIRTAIQRLKDHVKTLKTEFQIKDYLRDDLKKHGYKLVMVRKAGFRPKVIK